LTLVGLSLVCAYLTKTIPELIGGMISGTSMGAALRSAAWHGAAGAAAAAAAGTMMAGGANAAGGAAGAGRRFWWWRWQWTGRPHQCQHGRWQQNPAASAMPSMAGGDHRNGNGR
jgi:type IV secretion system protein TrbL